MPCVLSKENYIAFSEGLANYTYINKDGRLDLEDFCVTLAACLLHDGTGLKEARPENFHALLLELLHQRITPQELKRWVQSQRLVDWTPQMSYMYPERKVTNIHISALISYGHEWIALIGSHVLGINDEECTDSYFGWAKEEWHFTHEFLSGYHDAIFTFVKEFDANLAIRDGKPSNFEILRFSMKEGIDYEDAANKLGLRDGAWKFALERISKSREDGYHLEAISLSENLITNLLYNWLSDRNKVRPESTLNVLLQQARASQTKPEAIALLEEVDLWRKERNIAIHKFVASRIDDLTFNRDTISTSSDETSRKGLEIVTRMLSWYREEAVNFIEHRFPRQNINS